MACETNTTKRVLPATFAWALLLLATGLFFAYPCWYLMKYYSVAIPVAQGVITFFVIANFSLATFMDPGVIPKALPDEYSSRETEPLHMDIEIKSVRIRLKWCVTCQFFRPPRCTHCGICDSCIERFDHHCPWVNNCIGRRNYRYFFMFLLWLSIHMISIFSLCVLFMQHHLNRMHELQTIFTLVIMAIILVLIIPIVGLTLYHVVLIFRGRTTNEQVTGKFQDVPNPYSKGCCKNLMYILCSSPYPSFKKWSRKNNKLLARHYTELENSTGHQTPEQVIESIRDSRRTLALDHIIPSESHSKDCEPSPPPYHRNSRNNLYLNFSPSAYGKSTPYYYGRSSRALTPPVANQNSHRFDNLRRSLPPQNRFHNSAQHSPVQHTLSGSAFYMQSDGRPKCTSSADELATTTHYQQHPDMYQMSSPLLTLTASSQMHMQLDHKKDLGLIAGTGAESSLPALRFEDKNSLDMSDTCCLGNQTVDKLQEIATRTTMAGPLTVEACMQEAFNKRCTNFHGNHNRSQHDTCHIQQSNVVAMISAGRNTCVDCQRTTSSRSSLASMEHMMSFDMSRVPGRRPLSFVKAMEMSDALEPVCPAERLYLKPQDAPSGSSSDVEAGSVNVNSSGCEVSYEIRV